MLEINKFNSKQILEKFQEFKIDNLECLFVAADLGKIGLIPGHDKNYLLESIFNNLRILNPNLTIVVPTATINLVNSQKKFNIIETPSNKMGPFSEYIRKLKDSIRSYHAIWSLSANGPLAEFITKDISRHAYDYNSSFSRLFKIKKSSFLSIGKHPRFMLSIIHYFENMFKVPYRFKKEFNISCEVNNKYSAETFSLDVLKNEFRDKPRAYNKKIFENFEKKEDLKQTNFGKGNIYYFDLNKFYSITKNLFEEDLNCWWK